MVRPRGPPRDGKKIFFQISSEAHHLYVILRADHEYRIYISIGLSFVAEKCILLLSGLWCHRHIYFIY